MSEIKGYNFYFRIEESERILESLFCNMIYYLIPLVIIIASLLAIIVIVVKKFPSLAAINIESIAKEKESRTKNKILLERLKRKYLSTSKLFKGVTKPLMENLNSLANSIYQKTLEMEKKSIKKSQPLKKIDLAQEIRDKLEAIGKFIADGDYKNAEEMSISIIEIDANNLDAYELLADIYIYTKDYKKARETSRYLIKLLNKSKDIKENNRLANSYANLGTIYELEEKGELALNNYKRAVELEPNNPRFLDLLLKISIILKDKNLALEAFNNLREADPDNQKLEEIKVEVDSLEG